MVARHSYVSNISDYVWLILKRIDLNECNF
jgi:hypothetical protein